MLIFKALHILSMFTMVAVFIGGEMFYAIAIRGRDVHALAWLHRIRRPIGAVAFAAMAAGIVFGLLTAATGGMDFLEGWLLVAYLLLGVFVLNGAVNERPTSRLAERAVEAEAGLRPVDEVVRDMASDRRAMLLFVINATIFAAIILDMVLKPF